MGSSTEPNGNYHNDAGEKIVVLPQLEYSTLPEVVPDSSAAASSSQPQQGFVPPSTSAQPSEQQGFVTPPIENHPLFRHEQSPSKASSSGFVPFPTDSSSEYLQAAIPYTQAGSHSSPANLSVDTPLEQPHSPPEASVPPIWGATTVPRGDSHAITSGLPPPPPYELSPMPNQPGIALQTGPFISNAAARSTSPRPSSSVYSPVSPPQSGHPSTFSPISPVSTAVARTPASLNAMHNMAQNPPTVAPGAMPAQPRPTFQPQTRPGQMPGYGPPQEQSQIAKMQRSRRKLKIWIFVCIGALLFIIAVIVGVSVSIMNRHKNDNPNAPPPPGRRNVLSARWNGETRRGLDMGFIGVGSELRDDVFGGGVSKKGVMEERDALPEVLRIVGGEPAGEEDHTGGKLASSRTTSAKFRRR